MLGSRHTIRRLAKSTQLRLRLNLRIFYDNSHRLRIHFAKMRTYDDTFSGTKIYPGKVSPTSHSVNQAEKEKIENSTLQMVGTKRS